MTWSRRWRLHETTSPRRRLHDHTREPRRFRDAVVPRRPISVPYLPYFSNCREWDSYVVFHNLVESDRCELPPETTREGAFSDPTAPKLTPLRRYAYPPLPHYDDVQAVKFLDIALGFDKVPLADWCERRVTCSYEEVTTGGYLPLWCGPGVHRLQE